MTLSNTDAITPVLTSTEGTKHALDVITKGSKKEDTTALLEQVSEFHQIFYPAFTDGDEATLENLSITILYCQMFLAKVGVLHDR